MPKFLSQLNLEEAKINSKLQFRNKKKREVESRRNRSSSNFARAAKRNLSRLRKFRNTAKFRSAAKLPCLPAAVHLQLGRSND